MGYILWELLKASQSPNLHLYKLKAIRDDRCSCGELQTFEHLSQNCNLQQVEQIVNANPVVLYNTDEQN